MYIKVRSTDILNRGFFPKEAQRIETNTELQAATFVVFAYSDASKETLLFSAGINANGNTLRIGPIVFAEETTLIQQHTIHHDLLLLLATEEFPTFVLQCSYQHKGGTFVLEHQPFAEESLPPPPAPVTEPQQKHQEQTQEQNHQEQNHQEQTQEQTPRSPESQIDELPVFPHIEVTPREPMKRPSRVRKRQKRLIESDNEEPQEEPNEAPEHNLLPIKRSNSPTVYIKRTDKGLGGFANILFRRGDFITYVDIHRELEPEEVEKLQTEKRRDAEYLIGTRNKVWQITSRYTEGNRDVGGFLNTCDTKGTNNCKFIFSHKRWKVVATRTIMPHDELLVSYNKAKRFPENT